jgi:hypothetical protein
MSDHVSFEEAEFAYRDEARAALGDHRLEVLSTYILWWSMGDVVHPELEPRYWHRSPDQDALQAWEHWRDFASHLFGPI